MTHADPLEATPPAADAWPGAGATAPLPAGPVVAATTGAPVSDGALRVAARLAARAGAPVLLAGVLDPGAFWYLQGAPECPAASAETAQAIIDDAREALRAGVAEQARRVAGDAGARWPATIRFGSPADALAAVAHEHDARVLVTGRARHGLVGRVAMGEIVLHLLRLGAVPVLAVEQDADALPRCVLVATDFSPPSVYAARVALAASDPAAEVCVAHVAAADAPAGVCAGVDDALARLCAVLSDAAERDRATSQAVDPAGAPGAGRPTVTPLRLAGSPGAALVACARERGADLVAAGSHGYGAVNRLLLGSVATALLRGAPCSLLAVPGRALARA